MAGSDRRVEASANQRSVVECRGASRHLEEPREVLRIENRNYMRFSANSIVAARNG